MNKVIILCALIYSAFAGTNLYVKYPGKSPNYNSIQEAVDKAANYKPNSESKRVTIHIAPGKYRHQVIINTPYITLVNDEPSKGDVTITWYYGIGYKYFSANAKGYYDSKLRVAKKGRNIASKWGATVQIWNNAKYFKAKNIIFENSFNRYMTTDEISDGIQLANDKKASSITFQRTSKCDVQTRAATERAAAITIEAPYAEFLNCKFYSSQDTLYTGASPSYFKKCLIEGQTDYIFGQSNAVFDFCNLRWKGYSGASYPGYITAARANGNPYTGYLFNKCSISKNSSLKVVAGYLGRPWGNTAKVMFINTSLADSNTILPAGWYEMSGVKPLSVKGLKENGTKYKDGKKVDLSKRQGYKVSDNDARTINKKNYMNNWTPSYLNA